MIAFRDRVKVIIKIFENITGKNHQKWANAKESTQILIVLQLIDSSHLYSISKYFHSKNYLIFCIPQGSNDV